MSKDTTRISWPVLVIPFVLAAFAASAEESAITPALQAPSAISYGALVEKAEAGDTNIDFTALRSAYAQSDVYDPYGVRSRKLALEGWDAFQKHDCDTVFAKTDEALKADYTIMFAHIIRGDCFEQAGKAADAERERAIGKGLADSILKSGDGKSMETAFHAETLGEENMVLTFLNVHPTKQSLLKANGHSYDLMEGVDTDTGKPQGVYFNVDDMLMADLKMLQKIKASSPPSPKTASPTEQNGQ